VYVFCLCITDGINRTQIMPCHTRRNNFFEQLSNDEVVSFARNSESREAVDRPPGARWVFENLFPFLRFFTTNFKSSSQEIRFGFGRDNTQVE